MPPRAIPATTPTAYPRQRYGRHPRVMASARAPGRRRSASGAITPCGRDDVGVIGVSLGIGADPTGLPFVGRYGRARRRRRGGPGAAGKGVGDTMTISPPTGLALESIAEVDPVLWEAMLGERRRQHDKIELIASENYVVRRGHGGPGLLADQQVRRGPAGQALLRRLRVRRRRRAARPGARPRPLPGRRARQRPAALGRPGQHGRVLQRPRAGRPDHGHEPRPRRPPDARHGAELLGQAVRGPRLRGPPGHRAHRLRRDGGPGARGPAQADRRRAPRPTRAPGTSSGWRRSPPTSVRSCSSTWRTSPASWRPVSTRARSRTPTW